MKKLVLSITMLVSWCIVTSPVYGQSGGFPQDPLARRLTEQGGQYVKDKSFLEARQALEQAVKIEPSNGLIHFRLGRAYGGLGNPEAALKEYLTSMQLKPHVPVTAYNIADCYQSLGQLDKAIEWFEKYVKEEPTDSLVVMAQQRIKALSRIASTFRSANKDGPDYFDSLYGDKGPEKWPQEEMPVRVFIDAGSGIPSFPADFPRLLYESLQIWVQSTNGRLRVEVVADPHAANLYCDWTTNPKELKANATGAESGHTDVQWSMSRTDPSRTRKIYRAHVRVLVAEANGQFFDNIKLQKICLHELGHALGLQGHSGNPKDIMYFGESSATLPALSNRDKATVVRLYSE